MRFRHYLSLLLLLLVLTWLTYQLVAASAAGTLSGVVLDADGAVAGAVVRFKGQSASVRTDTAGRFVLPTSAARSSRVTASKEGYFITGAGADTSPLVLALQRLPVEDNLAYDWVDPAPDATQRHNCGNCHAAIFREWSTSGHARSATGRHFRNLYDGSDWQGKPNVGWNLLADNADGAGVCTSCHAPAVPFDDPAYYDLRQLKGVARHGVHCDYCHKVADVAEGRIGWTHGRFGLKLLRPFLEEETTRGHGEETTRGHGEETTRGRGDAATRREDDGAPRPGVPASPRRLFPASPRQLFFGPLDDVDRGEDAFSRLYRSSRYCASCHEGVVFGVHVYSTYSEWLASPARAEGKQCQNCHMKPTGSLTNIAPGRGGLTRNPHTLASHVMLDGDLPTMLRHCLSVSGRFRPTAAGLEAAIEVRADGVGHRVPTGFVDRNLVLVVEALGRDGAVGLRSGPVLPALAGKDYTGLPGRLFAKQLQAFDGHSPAPFWKARTDPIDTRLLPGQPDRSVFVFGPETDRVRVRVLYRRFWPEVAARKGWPDDTLTVLVQEWSVAAGKGK